MKKIFVAFVLLFSFILIFSGCNSKSVINEEYESMLNEIEILTTEIETEKEINEELSSKVRYLESDIRKKEDSWKQELSLLNEKKNELGEQSKVLYRDALLYRNDVNELLDITLYGDGYMFYDLDSLTAEQRQAVTDGINQYLDEYIYNQEENIDDYDFLGDTPSPQTIFYVLGIFPSTAKYYRSELENEVIHMRFEYYIADIPIDTSKRNTNQVQYQLRNFYDGIGEYHIVIENIDDSWKCVYCGIG